MFAENEEIAKINKAVVEDNIEGLPSIVPEELTNEELLELKQESTAEEEAREKKLQEKKKKRNTPLKKIHGEGFKRGFCRSQQVH